MKEPGESENKWHGLLRLEHGAPTIPTRTFSPHPPFFALYLSSLQRPLPLFFLFHPRGIVLGVVTHITQPG